MLKAVNSEGIKDVLSVEPLHRLIPRMALPLVVLQVLNAAYNIVDRLYLGHYDGGAESLAAIGAMIPVILVFSGIGLLSSGGAHLAALALGRGRRENASEYAKAGFAMSLTLGTFITLLTALFHSPILHGLGISGDGTYIKARTYLLIYLVGTIPSCIVTALTPFVSAEGRSGWTLAVSGIGFIVNLILDPVFIFILDWGIAGAAIATSVSQFVSFGLLLIYFIKYSDLEYPFTLRNLNRSAVLSSASIGISHAFRQIAEAAVNAVLIRTLSSSGNIYAVASMSIFSSIMTYGYIPLTGFMQGCSPVLGHALGSGNEKRAWKIFRVMAVSALAFTVLLVSSILIWPRVWVSVFTDNEDLISYAAGYIRIYFAGLMFYGLYTAIQQSFLSAGRRFAASFFALFRKIAVLIPLILIMYYSGQGVRGIFAAESIADVISVLVAVIFALLQLRKSFRKAILAKEY